MFYVETSKRLFFSRSFSREVCVIQVEDQTKVELWLGQTASEFVSTWEHRGWRAFAFLSLEAIINDVDTTTEDRLGALKLLNEAMRLEILPIPRDRDMVGFMCDVMLKVVRNAYHVPWWRRLGLKRRQAAIVDKLTALTWLINTGGVFMAKAQAESSKIS